ncbi:erythromycin esterase-like protein [Actinoplanes lutulentus]|uniref:Erythromycin esterase-like protein n=1 Tax=Actinoplanes lutulentus TaxID=1287878 RepID=A0A327ZE66_9ACTN|nr:erythromycin esterase family protein [Actinoplanes lutulentus]MBB2949176.1 erythromycin esterase-like protein [Actinoplanes lutulentus]RAK34660.1 erythromycin esterase-like protein [Actinoplanes lutulentus]
MIRYGDDVASMARPLRDPGDLEILLDRAAGARVVQIGEATHGTHEFYAWRAALTRRLIEERGFSFVAVEGDWPDCDRVDAAVRCAPGAPDDPRAALVRYDRWPTWMWANEETVDFTRWLRGFNAGRPADDRAGFHGLDVYSLWESMHQILTWLREHDPELVPAALDAYRCFEPYAEDPNAYAWSTQFVAPGCEDRVARMLAELTDRDFGVGQNAAVVAGAEGYYRNMVKGGPDAWNIRDRHMDQTLDRLLNRYGPTSKAVVWAHNTHVGDARATDQSIYGEVTLGQLARERYGDDEVVLVGFGTYRGTVVAGPSWGGHMEVMGVPEARPGSLEDVLHATAPASGLLVFPAGWEVPDLLATDLAHRAIGVVYDPRKERRANYVPTILGSRYDAFLWFDETHALRPLHTLRVDTREPETYPSGV